MEQNTEADVLVPGNLAGAAQRGLTNNSTLKLLRSIDRLFLLWAAVALLFWSWFLVSQEFLARFLYFYLWILGVGVPCLMCRERVAALLKRWQSPEYVKFYSLVLAMVMIEELIAAFCIHLEEGFSAQLYLRRILQFWALNIMTFCGPTVAYCLLRTRFAFSNREIFYLAGFFGIFFEKIYLQIIVNPIAFFATAPLIVVTYGLIFAPALMAFSGSLESRPLFPFRIVIGIVVTLLCALPFIAAIEALRGVYPSLFPPVNLIR